MPQYDMARGGPQDIVGDLTWQRINWTDTVAGDAFGGGGLGIGGSTYTSVLTARVKSPGGTRIQTRTVEAEKQPDGTWKVVEENPVVEHTGSLNDTFLQDVRNGKVAEHRRLWWQIATDADSTLTKAEASVQSWGSG